MLEAVKSNLPQKYNNQIATFSWDPTMNQNILGVIQN